MTFLVDDSMFRYNIYLFCQMAIRITITLAKGPMTFLDTNTPRISRVHWKVADILQSIRYQMKRIDSFLSS